MPNDRFLETEVPNLVQGQYIKGVVAHKLKRSVKYLYIFQRVLTSVWLGFNFKNGAIYVCLSCIVFRVSTFVVNKHLHICHH